MHNPLSPLCCPSTMFINYGQLLQNHLLARWEVISANVVVLSWFWHVAIVIACVPARDGMQASHVFVAVSPPILLYYRPYHRFYYLWPYTVFSFFSAKNSRAWGVIVFVFAVELLGNHFVFFFGPQFVSILSVEHEIAEEWRRGAEVALLTQHSVALLMLNQQAEKDLRFVTIAIYRAS